MHEVKSNLYPCAHCGGTGTCKNGSDNSSCAVCQKEQEVKGKGLIGLPCSVCGGIGQAEPRTERLNKRMPALLGFVVIFLLLLGVFSAAVFKSPYFSEVLAFSGPLIGTVLGFYYSARGKQVT
ncbi:molecular chaperone DnaJ [Azotobacter chroococcum]|uniref:Molecular chaperone DnaJ n=1 Tax=Azotobacter chroococcum TaxID=353 RepID=A0AA43Z8Z3_9GAMM|nr:molecular chaperone DnaJ [Azotobacter chroococcum]NHN78582.1 molecular chaperone DnaJ [Azotobacter chroococcum]